MSISATTVSYTSVTTAITSKNNDISSEETYKSKYRSDLSGRTKSSGLRFCADRSETETAV